MVENTWNHLPSLPTIHFSFEFTQSKIIGVIHCGKLKTATNSLLVFTLKWSLISFPLNLGWPQWLAWWIKYSRNDLGFPRLSHKEPCSFQSSILLYSLGALIHHVKCQTTMKQPCWWFYVLWFCALVDVPTEPQLMAISTRVTLIGGSHVGPYRSASWIPPSNLHQHHVNWALPGFLTHKIMKHKKMVLI